MRRHPFDPWSFVLGLLFLITGVAFLTDSIDLLHTSPATVWPIPVLAVGLLIVLTSVRRARHRQALAAGPPAPPDIPEDAPSPSPTEPPTT